MGDSGCNGWAEVIARDSPLPHACWLARCAQIRAARTASPSEFSPALRKAARWALPAFENADSAACRSKTRINSLLARPLVSKDGPSMDGLDKSWREGLTVVRAAFACPDFQRSAAWSSGESYKRMTTSSPLRAGPYYFLNY